MTASARAASLSDIVLYVAKAMGLFAFARYATRRGLRILCYHGFELADERRFRPKLFVTMDDFGHRLDLLARKRYTVLTLTDALARLRNGTLPPAAVAITIDDGFYAVYKAAAPALKRYGFNATVYVPTYYVEKSAPIFRLVVRYMFALTPLQRIDARDKTWLQGEVVTLATDEQRERAANRVIEYGESCCDEPRRQQLCQELAGLLAMDYRRLCESRLLSLMNAAELREVREWGIDVQLHTHRHRFPSESKALARAEIEDNRRALERVLGPGHFTQFCYPSGHYTVAQWPWLGELGVENATTCEVGLNYADTPPFGLKRFLDDSTISLIRFEAELSGFLEQARRARMIVRRFRAEPSFQVEGHDVAEKANS
jgi:peptidoglycan/xylan/chitin deacetylase (PgdA/CDA1 family)